MLGMGLNRALYNSAEMIDNASERIGHSLDIFSNQTSGAINNLSDVFSKEFESKDRRLVSLELYDEEGEKLKLSEYFSEVPVFKSDFVATIRLPYKDKTLEVQKEMEKDYELTGVFHKIFEPSKYISYASVNPLAFPAAYTELLIGRFDAKIPMYQGYFNYELLDFESFVNHTIDALNEHYDKNRDHITGIYKLPEFYVRHVMTSEDRNWKMSDKLKEYINHCLEPIQEKLNMYKEKMKPAIQSESEKVMKQYCKKDFKLRKCTDTELIYIVDENKYLTCKMAPNVNVQEIK